MRQFWSWGVALLLASGGAHAQRADENAVTAAQDAFGTTIGSETIGLYRTGDVRGFDSVQAGNARLEGLYFDRPAEPGGRLLSGSTVYVGLSAQSYPFPAPTGISDFKLRIPGERRVTSVVASYGTYDQKAIEVDTQQPIVKGKLSVGVGADYTREDYGWGGDANRSEGAVVARWTPNDRIEVVPFWGRTWRYDSQDAQPIFLAGAFNPPRIPRHRYYGQDWAHYDTVHTTAGVLGRFQFSDDWTLRSGVFRSEIHRFRIGSNLFRNTQPDGTTDRFVVLQPENYVHSTSGEVRLTGVMTEGARRHTFQVSARGRSVSRLFGGSVTIPLGPGKIGVPDPEPEPTNVVFGAQSDSHLQQGTLGVAYEALWRGVGEASLGMQKSFYHRTLNQPGLPVVVTDDKPWLVNGTVAAYLSPSLAIYASYTRGLEDSPDAPNQAVNRGEAVPASRTSQIDAGVRYAITPRLRIVAGVFQVKKPYFSLNNANVYTRLGEVTHKGIELSLTGQITKELTLVGGTVFLKPRIISPLVAQGLIGETPLGRVPTTIRGNLLYSPMRWKSLSFDMQLETVSERFADRLNLARSSGRAVVSMGARYRFAISGAPSTLRVQVFNVNNAYGWVILESGSFEPNEKRRVFVSLATDF